MTTNIRIVADVQHTREPKTQQKRGHISSCDLIELRSEEKVQKTWVVREEIHNTMNIKCGNNKLDTKYFYMVRFMTFIQ